MMSPRQQLLTVVQGAVALVAQRGPDAARLRKLRRADADGPAAVKADALTRLVKPSASVEQDFYAAAAEALTIPALIVRCAPELADSLRKRIELGEFFEHPLGSFEQLKVVTRSLNTSLKAFTRARRRSRVRSSDDPAKQHAYAKDAYNPKATRPVVCNPELEVIGLEISERMESFLSSLKPKDRRLAQRIIEMADSETRINIAALQKESKAWGKNGRGIARSNIKKMCSRLL